MKDILFMLMVVMIAASAIVYAASEMEHGYMWAYDVCRVYSICEHINWLIAATATVVVAYLLVP